MNSTPPSDHDEQLDDLVYCYLEQRDGGASHESALGEALSKAPDREGDLRRSLEALQAAGLVSPDGVAREDFPSEVGGYHLKRRLGAGGMGVVFLGEDSGGARAAVKLIRPEQLYFDRARARFERELESASRLDHPGIASVLGSGEERGIPYLAQAWIPGVSLDKLLAMLRSRIPEELCAEDLRRALESCMPGEAGPPQFDEVGFAGTWEKSILRVVQQVAEALEHAHSRGVLHRDVKPSNLMLTPKARVVLVDFGLARTPDASNLTRTGAQPGSLPYMAPEQVDGSPQDVDARADVYGLGVTMYELLTLRQPFKSRSTERVRAQIIEANPLPVRRLNGQVGRAVEIVCQKAMDRDPKRRYRSAGEFAADLGRLLKGEPTQARPPGVLLRSSRWVKRKPAHAAALLFAVAIPLAWAGSTQSSMSEVQAAYRQEQEARNVLDRHLEMTMGAIRSLFEELSTGAIKHTPHLQRTRLVSIDLALKVIDELYRENPGNLSVRAEAAHLQRRRADVLAELGRDDEAFVAYESHIASFRELLVVGPAERELGYKRELSLSLERRASLLTWLGPIEEAIEPYEEALDLLREVARRMPEESGARAQLVRGLNVYSSVLRKSQYPGDAFVAAEEGLALAEELLMEFRGQAQTLQNVASLRATLMLVEEDLTPEAELLGAQGIVALLEEALLLEPENRRLLEDLSNQQSVLSVALMRAGDPVAATRVMVTSVQGMGRLAREFPSILRYPAALGRLLSDYGVLLSRTGGGERGRVLLREQAEVAERLFLAEQSNSHLALEAATVLHNWAVNLTMTGDAPEQAFEVGDRAQVALNAVRELDPEEVRVAVMQLLVDYNRVLTGLRLGRWEAGREQVAGLEEGRSTEVVWLPFQADLWAEWVDCVQREEPGREDLAQQGRDLALDALEQAVDEGFDDGEMLAESEVLFRVLGDEERWVDLAEYLGIANR